jgi:tripartite-type tricarboxylate transporter receptor subunit TctC
MQRRNLIGGAVALALLGSTAAHAQAGDWPSRPIRLIAPFAAGSTSDTSARFIAQHLSTALGQPVTVENFPGADGRLGMMQAKNAPADGYTLVLGSWTNLAVNAVLIKDMPYDPVKDFKPVAGIGRSMLGVAVSGQSPITTWQELVAAAKKKPGELNYGNFATGYRLATEWFSHLAGIRFTYVPYRATGQMNTDLAGRQIDVAMDGVTSMSAMAKSGQLRLLAVTGEQRHPEFPNVPTLKEFYPDYTVYGWSSLMVRTEVPDAIAERVAAEVQKIMSSPEGKDFARRAGSDLLLRNTDRMREFQVQQINTFKRVAEAAGMKPE